ncbi:MAG: hypothetical protein RL208_399 [Pseudomonadota bacterium]|jgi:hypothetical protein
MKINFNTMISAIVKFSDLLKNMFFSENKFVIKNIWIQKCGNGLDIVRVIFDTQCDIIVEYFSFYSKNNKEFFEPYKRGDFAICTNVEKIDAEYSDDYDVIKAPQYNFALELCSSETVDFDNLKIKKMKNVQLHIKTSIGSFYINFPEKKWQKFCSSNNSYLEVDKFLNFYYKFNFEYIN